MLDPEQNATFNDHYLEVDYDLSSVMFVTTANTLNIPPPLMDRMEIIRIAGYTEDEKLEIAKRHLLPNSMGKHGLDAKEFEVEDSAVMELIRRYTREAGVRNLEREISNLARKAVKEILTTKKKKIVGHRRERRRIPRRRRSIASARSRRTTRSAWSRVWPGPRSAASC